MIEKYISLEEAAKLENIPYDTIKARIRRNPGKYKTKREAHRPNGGRPRVFVSISSLKQNKKHIQTSHERTEQMRTERAIMLAAKLMNAILRHRRAKGYSKEALGTYILQLVQRISGEYAPDGDTNDKGGVSS